MEIGGGAPSHDLKTRMKNCSSSEQLGKAHQTHTIHDARFGGPLRMRKLDSTRDVPHSWTYPAGKGLRIVYLERNAREANIILPSVRAFPDSPSPLAPISSHHANSHTTRSSSSPL